MTYRAIIATLLFLFAGCSRESASSASDGKTPPAHEAILVRVNDTLLTRGDLEKQVSIRLADLAQRGTPPEAMAEARKQMTARVVDQFVMRTLLLMECDRLGITVSSLEQAEALSTIESQVAQTGQTLEEMLEKSPLGRDHMLNEIQIGLRINKVIAHHVPPRAEFPPEEVERFIESHPELFETLPAVRARHILVSVDPAETDAGRAQKRSLIESHRARVLAGEDFEAVAREVSDCPSSSRGGDLGTFTRGSFEPPLENAAFELQVGDTSPVIESSKGFHILQVTEKKQAAPSDALLEKAISLMRRDDSQQRLQALIKRLQQNATVQFDNELKSLISP